jgi:hypothetical protein
MVRNYVEQSISLRALSKANNVSKTSIHRWLNQLKGAVLSPVEIALNLKPQWGNILLIDAKQIGSQVVMIAVDYQTGDVVLHYLCDSENEINFKQFLLILRDNIHYSPMAIVSDLGKGKTLPSLIRSLFPEAFHQVCIIHFWRYVCMKIPISKKSSYYLINKQLRDSIKKLLWAKTKSEADQTLNVILSHLASYNSPYHKSIIKSLVTHFNLLTTHHSLKDVPKTNNAVENVNRQLERRLKVTDNFHSKETLDCFLNLWFLWLRFQIPCNSTNKKYKYFSRLDRAKINTQNLDWFSFALSKNSNT